ncbi:MAG TPA: SIS domain-containing protein [Rhodocyclaceae bacterium]|nr:SIS domain-containing protein [Rhodocyclaceae bacterium]
MGGLTTVKASLLEARQGLDRLLSDESLLATIAAAGEALAQALQQGGKVYSCGNGGSMCDAMHFAEELSGRYRKDRPALAALSISDPSHMSCVSNDYGYEHVFSRFLQAHIRSGDVLLAISTSGASPSILNATQVARAAGATVIGLHGRPGSALAALAEFDLVTPAGQFADRVQELHIKVIHILIELVERRLFPANYV